jgi:predicted phosphoribosyltransferase
VVLAAPDRQEAVEREVFMPPHTDGPIYRDRHHAGRVLAERLQHLRTYPRAIVLALPRGGVPVAYQVAQALDAPLDVFLVRKLGVPGHSELAMGAIASGGTRVINQPVVDFYGLPPSVLDSVARYEQAELGRRERAYRGGQPPLELRDYTVILVDDGLATGSTMKAAVEAVRSHAPARIVVAVPVGAPDTCQELSALADEMVCVYQPADFAAVGSWYEDFSATSDQEVRQLLAHGARQGASG